MVDNDANSDPLIARVCAEFLEMPGMQLTRRQAQRLWGCDAETCVRVIDALIAARFLRRVGLDRYARVGAGAR
jgi:hypothetical protein